MSIIPKKKFGIAMPIIAKVVGLDKILNFQNVIQVENLKVLFSQR